MTLTQEILKELLNYDNETGLFTWKHRPLKWFATERAYKNFNNRFVNKEAGCIFTGKCGKSYLVIGILNKSYLAHRLVLLFVNGRFPINEVDHHNGNGCDNRLKNLSEATAQENQRNKRKSTNNTSGETGVCWDKRGNYWQAKISVNNKTINLGAFKNKDEAIMARKKANNYYFFHENQGSDRTR
jgi:hypothetical protein